MYYLSNTKIMQKDIRKIIKILWWLEEKDRENFFKVLFTDKEIEEFSKRIDVLTSLKNWKTQREISKNLDVSITTVTRWNKFYKNNKDLVDKYL